MAAKASGDSAWRVMNSWEGRSGGVQAFANVMAKGERDHWRGFVGVGREIVQGLGGEEGAAGGGQRMEASDAMPCFP